MELEPVTVLKPRRDSRAVVCAPDSFKECMSAAAVARAMALGVRDAVDGFDIVEIPMADGGEGTVEALLAAKHGEWAGTKVTGPNGEPVNAEYGLIDHGRTAVIEMAAASGLHLVPETARNALTATTRGTGELIRDALDRGVRHILIGVGGSATTDGGAGMAAALGAKFLDADGNELPDGGGALERLHSIDTAALHPALSSCNIEVACDVRNPLCGTRGCAHVYGPQKGATPDMVETLDRALENYAAVIKRDLGHYIRDVQGAGAAGGTAAGLMVFTNAELRPGFDMVASACGLESAIAGAALVLTGEGKMDFQSAEGKTPVGVGKLAAHYGVTCAAIVGTTGEGHGWKLAQETASLAEVQTLDTAAKKRALDPIRDARVLIRDIAADLAKRLLQERA